MKNLITLLFFIPFMCVSQQFKGFPTNNFKWVVTKVNFEAWQYLLNDFELTPKNDTIILGETYRVLVAKYSDTYKDIYLCYRNDFSTQQIKILPKGHTVEKTVFDFSKNIGDTIFNIYSENIYLGDNFINLKVIDVDSILLNNLYYKRMKLINYEVTNSDTIVWVDGFGNVGFSGWYSSDGYGFTNVLGPFSFTEIVKCYEFNNLHFEANWQSDTIYPITNCQTVFDYDLSVKQTSLNDISIYPNPATNYIVVKGVEQKSIINIYNSLGQLIKTQTINSANQKINLDDFNKGLYFVEVKSINNQVLYQNKVVKY